MIRDHAAVLQAMLEAQGLTVYPTGAPDDAVEPYAVLWTDAGFRTGTKLCVGSDRADFLASVVSVGTTAEQAQWVAEKAFAALLDQTPIVAGRSCDPITHDSTDPVHRDPDPVAPGGSIVYEQIDVFKLTTWPA
jgi:hypothetical protein